MNDPVSTTSPPPAPHGRPAPALLLFVAFPVIGLVIAIGMMLASGAAPTPEAPPTPRPVTLAQVPSPAPIIDAPILDFELPRLDGSGTVRLTDFAGRIVFLNFWATWCEPCKRELPALAAFSADSGDDGPVVLAVNIGESAETVSAFLEQQGITGLNVLLDQDNTAADTYAVQGLPTTYVIDAAGNVRYPRYGEIRREDMDGFVAALQSAADAGNNP